MTKTKRLYEEEEEKKMVDPDAAAKRTPESELADAKKLKPSPSPHPPSPSPPLASLHNGLANAHSAEHTLSSPLEGVAAPADEGFQHGPQQGEELLSDLDDESAEDSDDEGEDEEDSEDAVEEEASSRDRKNRKGKEAAKYEGKGKGKIDEGDSDVEDTLEDEDEGDLVEDPLEEVDLSNILPSRTRRKTLHPVDSEVKESSSDEDEDYIPT